LAGVTDMEDRVADVTVRVVALAMDVAAPMGPEVAVMIVALGARDVPRPLLLTVATDVLDEVHMTCVVISWLVPSEYAPEAAN